MTLQEYVTVYCPEGPAQLRQLILKRTGVSVPYAYVWKWCDPRKPCAVSIENAQLLHTATQGKCSLPELTSLKKIRERLSRKKPVRKTPAGRKAAAPKTPEAKLAEAKRRIAELERQIAAAASTTDAPDASQVA